MTLIKVLRIIEFQQKALREQIGDEKLLLSRDKNLVSLQLQGYERQPYMREYFALFIALLEGKLCANKQAIVNDMNKGRREWFHDILFKDGKTSTFYYGVNEIVDEHSKLVYTSQKTFKLNGLEPNKYYSVEQVFSANSELGKNIWTINYDKLSSKIKTISGITLPKKDIITLVVALATSTTTMSMLTTTASGCLAG